MALKAQGYDFDRRKIVLKDTIKETGDYTATVKLHRDVTLTIPVKVTAEGAETAAKAEKAETETAETTTEETES